jgi:GTP-binding protein
MFPTLPATFVKSSEQLSQCPTDGLPEYAFIGRSNVGKSSLINMLAGHNKLSKVSGTPGKTRLINHFVVGGSWYMVDLPGYGYARASQTTRRQIAGIISGYLRGRDELTLLFVLIDIRLAPQKADLDFLRTVGEGGIPCALVFTKSDKLSRSAAQASVERFLQVLSETWEEAPPHFVTSSEKGLGRDEILAYIEQVNSSLQKSSSLVVP